MAQNSNPFTPESTVSISVSGTTANVALGAGTGQELLIQNDGMATTYFNFGATSAVAAATTDTPILAGQSQIFTMPTNTTYIAAIGASGTLRITRGRGQ